MFEYFPLYGRAEPTKMMCAYYDQPFSEVTIEFAEWGTLKPQQDKYPFGSLPMAVLDGQRLGQTRSQQRMLAKIIGCYDIRNPMLCY